MSAATLSRFAKRPHRAAARATLAALTLGDPKGFATLAVLLRRYLTPGEAAMLFWAVSKAVEPEDLDKVLDAIVPPESRAGWPVVPLEDVAEEAEFWVRYASPSELRAYLMACFNTLPGEDRAGFLSVVTRRAAA